jgi:membrane protein DedA with SNARE-associated domain
MLDTLVADLTDVRLWMIVILVTVIGLIEKLAIYRAGQRSVETELSDVLGYSQERQARYEEMFRTRGAYILLLASIPGIGAAMSAVAGFVGVALAPFVIWVTISNLIRNWLIVLFTGQLASLF